MALHSTGQPWAREVWDAWSQHSTKYDAVKQEQSWGSFDQDRDKKTTLGTLFYLAQQAGWCPSGRAIPGLTQSPTPDADDPALRPALAHHILPDYLAKHPDPRVRRHWQRVYRRTAHLKAQLHAQGVI
jgi:hypothetical protein